jgi:hypothetical protein
MISNATDLAAFPQTSVEEGEALLDVAHLARQTQGDLALEREVLTLFMRLSVTQFVRLGEARDDAERRQVAHSLLGSALGIGAFSVADRARTIERAETIDQAMVDALGAAIQATRRFIAGRVSP